MPTIDLRLVDIHLELSLLGSYLRLLELHGPSLLHAEENRIWAELRDSGYSYDEDEIAIAHQSVQLLEDEIFPRLFYTAFIVPVWAVYESGVAEVAEFIRRRKGEGLRMNDLHGSFLKKAEKYYSHVLKFPLHEPSVLKRIETFNVIRDAVAHANGRIAALNEASQQRIQSILNSEPGVSKIEGSLVLSPDFIKQATFEISTALNDLVNRARTSF